jgi:hypothetical protein
MKSRFLESVALRCVVDRRMIWNTPIAASFGLPSNCPKMRASCISMNGHAIRHEPIVARSSGRFANASAPIWIRSSPVFRFLPIKEV